MIFYHPPLLVLGKRNIRVAVTLKRKREGPYYRQDLYPSRWHRSDMSKLFELRSIIARACCSVAVTRGRERNRLGDIVRGEQMGTRGRGYARGRRHGRAAIFSRNFIYEAVKIGVLLDCVTLRRVRVFAFSVVKCLFLIKERGRRS